MPVVYYECVNDLDINVKRSERFSLLSDDGLSEPLCFLQLKMRAGGMSESSKWKKQKRSPRPPRHMVRSSSGQMEPSQPSTLNNNLSGRTHTVVIMDSQPPVS